MTDTLPNSNTIKLAKNCDILIHEATFLNKMHELSKKHYHTTDIQAFKIASQASVKKLFLTHFDPKITNKELKNIKWNNQSCVVFNKKIDI